MAPPLKRRRLFFWTLEEVEDIESTTAVEQASAALPVFEHKVDAIDAEPAVRPDDHLESLFDESSSPVLRLQQRRDIVLRQEATVTASPFVVQAEVIVSVDGAASVPAVSASTTTAAEAAAAALSSTTASTSSETTPTPAQSITQSLTIAPTAATTTAASPGTLIAATGAVASSTLANDLSSISSSLLTISSASYTSASTSLSSSSSFTSSKNVTLAGDILASNLTLPSTSSKVSAFYPTSYSNSSIFLNATTSALFSSASTSTTSDASDLLTTYTTTDADGRPSTITTAVGAPRISTPATSPISEPTLPPTNSSNDPGPPPAGAIAGGVVGGAAGLAVLLLVAMLFVRWQRQRSRREHQALLPASHGDSDSANFVTRQPGMAESAGIRPLIAAFPLLNRHQPSSGNRSSQTAAPSSERGFQRLSGRKLPSAFSPGMENPQQQPPLPFTQQYRDSGASSVYPPTPVLSTNPFANRPGSTSPEDNAGLSRQVSDEQMTMLPGPQRRPTIHNTQASLHVPGESRHARHVSSSARTSGLLS